MISVGRICFRIENVPYSQFSLFPLFKTAAEKGLKKVIYSEDAPQLEAPVWVPDSCATTCSSCLTLFSFSVRRVRLPVKTPRLTRNAHSLSPAPLQKVWVPILQCLFFGENAVAQLWLQGRVTGT